ncbi:MAG TPA: hypothetical protein V6C95_16645 [Coleofasciculaceae cyanobacterium]
MAPNLKDAAKARRTRLGNSSKTSSKKVADKLAGKGKTRESKSPATPSKPALTTPTQATTTAIKSVVPGLTEIAPDSIAGMLPVFNPDSYTIVDPLNPPDSLPQVTEAEFNNSSTIYEGTQRALKLTGMAFDTVTERFNVVGKQARAFGSGIKAATEFQKTKGLYLDYQNQLEVNTQKEVNLEVSQHKTVNERSKAVHSKTESDQKLKQAEIAANLATETTQQKQNQLTEFQKQLGQFVPSK